MIIEIVRFTITAAATTLELLPNGIPFYLGSGSISNSRPTIEGAIKSPSSDGSAHQQPQLNLAVFMILFILCACEVICLKVISSLSIGGSQRIFDGIAAINVQRMQNSNAVNDDAIS